MTIAISAEAEGRMAALKRREGALKWKMQRLTLNATRRCKP
jgi:hypothetical protein